MIKPRKGIPVKFQHYSGAWVNIKTYDSVRTIDSAWSLLMIQKHLLHYSHNLLWRCKIQSIEETGEFKWRTLSDAKRRWNWKRKPLQLFLLLNHLLKLGARSHLRCTIVVRKLGKNSCTIKPNFIALISPETLVYNP